MRILLVRYYGQVAVNTAMPKSIIKAEGVFPPLGIAYLAAYLEKEGHAVRILDAQALHFGLPEIREELKRFAPDMVGITCTTPNVPSILQLSRLVKQTDRNICVVLGGPHLSVFPKEAVNFPFIDFGVVGEGEHTFAELASALEKRSGEFGNIRGLVWKKGGRVILNPERALIEDLDALPFPARHLLPMDNYDIIIMQKPLTTLIAARGCPYRCAYCFRDRTTCHYRMRSPSNIVDEIEECVQEYKLKEISFYDDCWPNRKALVSVCKEIRARGIEIRWNALQRVDLIDAGSLKEMKKAGCRFIRFGVESGSQRILDMMDKHITLPQVERAFKTTKEAGIKTFAFFMLGYATETDEEFRQTVEFAKKIDPDWIMFDTTVPLPGTKLWTFAVEKLGYDGSYWRKWSEGKCKTACKPLVPDAHDRCERAYKEFYLRPGYILKKAREISDFSILRKYVEGGLAVINFKGTDRDYSQAKKREKA